MPSSSLSPLGRMLVTTFGLGFVRPAPGTWGSMPTVALAAALILLGMKPGGLDAGAAVYNGAMLLVLIVFSAACVLFGDAAETRFGSKDPSHVVADETAGQAIPLLFLPAAAVATLPNAAATLLLAFVLFRLADILKLWPANGLQKIPGGWGILLDDLVAGVQAAVLVQAVTRLVFA